MKITKVFDRGDGTSTFGEVDIAFDEIRADGILSQKIGVNSAKFRQTSSTYSYAWHPTPIRQIVVVLEGAVEIEVGSGEKKTFTAGNCFLLEDTTGKGHLARAVGGLPRLSLNIELA